MTPSGICCTSLHKRLVSRWFSFSKGGICYFPGGYPTQISWNPPFLSRESLKIQWETRGFWVQNKWHILVTRWTLFLSSIQIRQKMSPKPFVGGSKFCHVSLASYKFSEMAFLGMNEFIRHLPENFGKKGCNWNCVGYHAISLLLVPPSFLGTLL